MKSCNWSMIVQSEADSGSIVALGPAFSFCSQAYCVGCEHNITENQWFIMLL